MRASIVAVVGVILLAGFGRAHALEGKLSPAAQDKINGMNWNMNYTNASGDVLVKAMNGWAMLKVTADPELLAFVVPKIKFENLGFINACDAVAKALDAKAFVQGEGVHFTRKGAPPAGGNAGGNGGGNAGGNAGGGAVQQPAGNAGGIEWTSKNAYGCKADRKPVVLFIFDKLAKSNDPVLNSFNNSLFMDPNVEKLLAGFTCVKLEASTALWPKDLVARAKTSGAVFVMTCEGTPLSAYDRGSGVPTAKAFVDACTRAAADNAKIVEKMVKEDQAKQAQDDDKKKPNGGGIPGLPPPSDKTGENPADKTKDPTKSGKVEDEGK